MSWLGFVLIWIGAIMMFFIGFRFGKVTGHQDGHICEATNRFIIDMRKENDND